MLENLDEKCLSAAIDKLTGNAIDKIAEHVTDDSRYLIFIWTQTEGRLQIGLANHDNKDNIQHLTEQSWPELRGCDKNSEPVHLSDVERNNEIESLVRFCLTDYLSSCNGFLRYALIALFHTGDASKSKLL